LYIPLWVAAAWVGWRWVEAGLVGQASSENRILAAFEGVRDYNVRHDVSVEMAKDHFHLSRYLDP